MAKHHPDLIFCRKQAGVGEFMPFSLLFEWDGIGNWELGVLTSSSGLWFGSFTFRALRSLGVLEARSVWWLLIRGQERESGSLKLAGVSVPSLLKSSQIA